MVSRMDQKTVKMVDAKASSALVRMSLALLSLSILITLINMAPNASAQVLWAGAPRSASSGKVLRATTAPRYIRNENENPFLEGVCGFPSLNPCIPDATCIPSVPIIGEARCQCPDGYSGDGFKGGSGCVNIDECRSNLHDCDEKTMECIDSQGSYECVCKRGYDMSPSRKSCIDIDECHDPALNNCDKATMTCRNVEGSFSCDCKQPSQIMDAGTRMCRDLNECVDMEGAMNPCEQRCINKDPGVQCGCEIGYRLREDARTCEDIDECANPALHVCDPIGEVSTCVNTIGGYYCECNQELGYRNSEDRLSCLNLNECEEYPYICGGAHSCCKDLAPPARYACANPNPPDVSFENVAADVMAPTSSRSAGGGVTQAFGLFSPLFGMSSDGQREEGIQFDPIAASVGDVSHSDGYVKAFTEEMVENSSAWKRTLQLLPALRTSAGLQNGPRGGRLGASISDGLNSMRLIRSHSCPAGFTLGVDLQRARTRAATMQAVQTALRSNTKDAYGEQKPVSPQEVSDSIVQNVAVVSSELQKWITELSSIPEGVVNAAGPITAPFEPTQRQDVRLGSDPALSAIANLGAAGGNGGTILGLEPSSWASLLIGGGIGKILECDPAHDPFCDRDGRSKELAYGHYD